MQEIISLKKRILVYLVVSLITLATVLENKIRTSITFELHGEAAYGILLKESIKILNGTEDQGGYCKK